MKLRPPSFPRRIALDHRGGEVYWVESCWTPRGLRVRRCGREAPRQGEGRNDFFRRLASSRRLRGAALSIGVRHPDLRVERLDLPPLSDRDARRVAERRMGDVAGGLFESASSGFVLARGKRARPAWLVACPAEFSELAERQWSSQGLDVEAFVAMPIALGCLARVLPSPEGGTLRAIVDFGGEHATCVVTDADGWMFSRETSAKLSGDPDANDIEREAGEPIDRIATQLRRTFHYVRTELGAGTVTEVVVSGERTDLALLARDLETRLELDVKLLGDAIEGGPAAGIQAGCGAALGIALHAELGGGNLLPRPSQHARQRRRATRRLVLAASVSALVFVAGAAHLGVSLSSLRDRSGELEQRWQATRTRRAETEAVSAARASARSLDQALESLSMTQPPWSSALESLGLLLPDEALVERLEATRNPDGWRVGVVVEFRGDDLATAANGVSRFTDALSASPLWRIRGVARRPTPALPDDPVVRVSFQIDADVAPRRREWPERPGPGLAAAVHGSGDVDG